MLQRPGCSGGSSGNAASQQGPAVHALVSASDSSHVTDAVASVKQQKGPPTASSRTAAPPQAMTPNNTHTATFMLLSVDRQKGERIPRAVER